MPSCVLPPRDEMPNDGDHAGQERQMDETARQVKHQEPQHPRGEENDADPQKDHCVTPPLA